MLIKQLNKDAFKPQDNLVAFEYIRQDVTKGGIFLPANINDIDLRIGKILLGRVIKTGIKATTVKLGDIILYHEYEPLNFEGTPNNKLIYFIKEDLVKGIMQDVEDPSKITIIRNTSEESEFQMMKKDKESFE